MKRAAASVSKSRSFVFAQARIDHQGEVQRLLRFRLEDFYPLLDAFLIDLELVRREVERGRPFLSNTLASVPTRLTSERMRARGS